MSDLINNIDSLLMTSTISNLEKLHGEITADYCSTLIVQGKTVVGYALYIAKEVVFKDDDIGYKLFIKNEGINIQSASRHIEFYTEGVAFNQPELFPSCPTAYIELSGNTAQDKVNRYTRLRKLLGVQSPTHLGTTDVRWSNALLNRGILDTKLVNTFAGLMYKRSDMLKRYYTPRTHNVGLKELIELMKINKSDGYIMDILDGIKDIKPYDKRLTSRKEWDKLSADDQYIRYMMVEEIAASCSKEERDGNVRAGQ